MIAGLLASSVGYANMYLAMILPLIIGSVLYYLLIGRTKQYSDSNLQ